MGEVLTLHYVPFNMKWEGGTNRKQSKNREHIQEGKSVQTACKSQLSIPITFKICLWVNGIYKRFPFVIDPDKELENCQWDFVFNVSLCKHCSSFREQFCIF